MIAGDENALRNARSKVLADIANAYSETRGYLNDHTWSIDSAVQGAVRTALNTASNIIPSLTDSGWATDRLLSGQWTWKQWLDRANLVRDNLLFARGQMSMSGYSWDRFWSEVVVTTGSEVKTLGTSVYGDATSILPWVAGAAIVLGIAYVVAVLK